MPSARRKTSYNGRGRKLTHYSPRRARRTSSCGKEAAGLETLRSELRTTYRAFLLAALELIKEHPFDDEPPAAEVLETALSPDTQRSADADAGVDLDADSEANADSTARDPLPQVEA